MISTDEFHRTMMEGFKEIREKMDNLHNETMKEVDEIKIQLNTLEDSYNIHVAVGDARHEHKDLSRKQKIGILLGVAPIVLAVYALFIL